MAISSIYRDIAGQTPPVTLVVSIAITYLVGLVLYQSLLSPLRKVPGPWFCRITPLWTLYHSYIGDECRLIDKLFKKYGSVVRVAPNEVVIADGAALAPIYSEKGGFLKAPCYSNFDFEGHATIFSALDPAHRHVRSKAVLPLFSLGNIRSRIGDIEKCVDQFVHRLEREANESKAISRKGGQPAPVNVLNTCRSLSLDAVSAYLFGRSYGGVSEETGRLSASGFVDSAVAIGRVFYSPNWLFRIWEAILEKFWPPDKDVEQSVKRVGDFADSLVEDSNSDDNTYQSRLLQVGITPHETAVQVKDLIFAGTDSTGTSLAKTLWYLSRNPSVFQKLRTEIGRADEEDAAMNPQAIPYLDAVVREGLRLGMANPARFPRQVPLQGFTFTTVHKETYFLPPGSLVGVQSYSLHLNSDVFPDPYAFKPERWLSDPTPDMQRDWFPFGLGQRQCIARNLAYMELLVTVRAVARANLLEGAKSVADSLDIYEWFNSKVVGEQIQLVWE